MVLPPAWLLKLISSNSSLYILFKLKEKAENEAISSLEYILKDYLGDRKLSFSATFE